MTERMIVTADKLNDVMSFGHVIQVHDDGTVSEPKNIWAPELNEGRLEDNEWNLLSGFTAQYGGGPVMHDSEYIGGNLAEHILTNPGIYVAVVAYWFCGCGESCCDNIEGWGVAVKN